MKSVLLIYIIIAFILSFAILLLFCANMIYLMILFISLVIAISWLILCLHLEFFAIIFTIIYLGVIIVFFLFTIMVLNLRLNMRFFFMETIEIHYAGFSFIILVGSLHYFILSDFTNLEKLMPVEDKTIKNLFLIEQIKDTIDIKTTGFFLYTKYGFYIFIVALLLLISLVASVQIIIEVKKKLKIIK